MVPNRNPLCADAIDQRKKYKFIDVGQFGYNQAIVESADVNLKSASFRYFVQKRG